MTAPGPSRTVSTSGGPSCRNLLLSTCVAFLATASTLVAADPTPLYRWTTFAGRATTGYDDGPAADARFNSPHGVALDASGNLYVADNANHTIRKITPGGIVSTLAGSPGQPGSADGTGSAARFLLPKGVAVDANGNVYVADTGNHTIRKITPAGVVTTLAGAAGFDGSTDGVGSAARFTFPTSIFTDATGNVYVPQGGLRRISPAGAVETIQLNGPLITPAGKTIADFSAGITAVDALGQVFFFARARNPDGSLDYQRRLIKRDVSGAYTVLASSDNADGKPFLSTVVSENLMTPGGDGALYFVTQLISSTIEYRLYKLTPDGSLVSTWWRSANRGGYADEPKGLTVAPDGKVFYTAPAYDDVVFLFNNTTTTVYAGTPWWNYGVDGLGAAARFSKISGLELAPGGGLLVSDNYLYYATRFYGGPTVRTVTSSGDTRTLYTGAPSDRPNETSLGVAPLADGMVAMASYYAPSRLTQISTTGTGTPLAKGEFQEIREIASDANGVLVVADSRAIHRRALDGAWTRLAGDPAQPAAIVDGPGSNARFAFIISLDVTPNGDAYVLDHLTTPTARAAIRRIQPNGDVTTVLANVIRPDGASPAKLTIDDKGDFVLTYSDDTVRLFTASGTEFIIGGSPGQYGIRDGDGQTARFYQPDAIVTDAQNNLYVADNARVTIRKGQFLGYSALISNHPQSLTVTAGSSAQFSVTASGTPAPNYQWQFNGTAIAGATGSTLNLANVSTANAGNYTVLVSNANGSVTSNAATLTVTTPNPPPPPPPSGGGGGGGGSPSLGFIAALLTLAAARGWQRRDRLLG